MFKNKINYGLVFALTSAFSLPIFANPVQVDEKDLSMQLNHVDFNYEHYRLNLQFNRQNQVFKILSMIATEPYGKPIVVDQSLSINIPNAVYLGQNYNVDLQYSYLLEGLEITTLNADENSPSKSPSQGAFFSDTALMNQSYIPALLYTNVAAASEAQVYDAVTAVNQFVSDWTKFVSGYATRFNNEKWQSSFDPLSENITHAQQFLADIVTTGIYPAKSFSFIFS